MVLSNLLILLSLTCKGGSFQCSASFSFYQRKNIFWSCKLKEYMAFCLETFIWPAQTWLHLKNAKWVVDRSQASKTTFLVSATLFLNYILWICQASLQSQKKKIEPLFSHGNFHCREKNNLVFACRDLSAVFFINGN